jgi:hypothetical protein
MDKLISFMMDYVVPLLLVLNLTLSAIFLVYKVPDTMRNGFEHNGFIYVNADKTNTDMVEQEYADPQQVNEGEV